MPPRAKGKSTAGAAAALTSAVGVEKSTRIKHGDLQHEADVKRSFSVPGSYWGDERPDDEKNQLFAAEIVEVTLTRKLIETAGRSTPARPVLELYRKHAFHAPNSYVGKSGCGLRVIFRSPGTSQAGQAAH